MAMAMAPAVPPAPAAEAPERGGGGWIPHPRRGFDVGRLGGGGEGRLQRAGVAGAGGGPEAAGEGVNLYM